MDARKPQREPRQGGTLGEVLYSDSTVSPESENVWFEVVRAVAARDPKALHDLYERTHRVVYTLALRLTGDAEAAETVTLEVFHDVWRNAASYDPANGTVLAWVMNQARSRSLEAVRKQGRRPEQAVAKLDERDWLLGQVLQTLSPDERLAMESTYFSVLGHADTERWNPALVARIQSGLLRLRQALQRET